MTNLVYWEGKRQIPPVNDSIIHWSESSTNTVSVYNPFHMSYIFTDAERKSKNLDLQGLGLLPEGQARYYSTVVVLVLAGLFFGFTLTVTLAVGVFCRKKNTVFVFQKAEQEEGGYEMRENDTEEDEEQDEGEIRRFEGRKPKDDHWEGSQEVSEDRGRITSLGPINSEPLLETMDYSDHPKIHHKSFEILENGHFRNARRNFQEQGTSTGSCGEIETRCFIHRDLLMASEPRNLDTVYHLSQESIDSSIESSENTVIEVTPSGRLLPVMSSGAKSSGVKSSGVKGDSACDDTDDDYCSRCLSDDEIDDEEMLDSSSFLRPNDSHLTPQMSDLIQEQKNLYQKQCHLLKNANASLPEVHLFLQEVKVGLSVQSWKD